MTNISSYRDVKWAIVRPTNSGIVTKQDKKNLGAKYAAMSKRYVAIWFPAHFESAFVDNIKKAKLSKKMLVTIITDAQFGLNGRKPATIEGTPFYATQKQLAESFIIG